ncbi:MAG: 30S ribosomal protein S1, partial [Candidatus Woesebacteria bacterium GW2011_GWA1_41_13b]
GKAAEGFIHISEVSYQRVENLPQKYKSGEKIKAQVIDVDSASRRVNLSIKRTEKDAFENAKEKYKPEQKIKGKVLDVKTRGVTFELESGINGFISSSKIPQGQTYNPGDTVEAEIVSIDEKRRVVILSPVLKAVPIGYR